MIFEQEKRENLRRIREFEESAPPADWDGSVSFFPRYLQIEHTTRCNARCIMCNHLYTANRGCRDLDVGVLCALEDILRYAETVMLNGDGEPFLCADIDKSLALFRKYGVSVGTNTNLTVIPDNVWEYLKDGFSFINVSCDGSEKALFETIRRGLSFDVFTDNLRKLNRVAPKLRKNLDCVLMRHNLGNMAALVRFAADNGFASVRFHPLGVNPVIGNFRDAPGLYPQTLAANARAAKEEAQRLGIELQLPAIPSEEGDAKKELREIEEEETLSRERILRAEQRRDELSRQYLSELVKEEELEQNTYDCGAMCRWAAERCYIDLSGNMTTCCYDPIHRYGNLTEQSFSEIWNGPLYKKLRLAMMKGKLPKWCESCCWIKNPVF